MNKIYAWGDGEYYQKYKDKLPFFLDGVITQATKFDIKISKDDKCIIMSISSYGAIYQDAVILGFKDNNITCISKYIEELTNIDYVQNIHNLNQSKILINRIDGEIKINDGLNLISEQHKILIETFKNSYIEFNNNTLYDNIEISVKDNAKLILGNNTYMNKNTTIRCYKNISIGSNCAISYNVNIADWGGMMCIL